MYMYVWLQMFSGNFKTSFTGNWNLVIMTVSVGYLGGLVSGYRIPGTALSSGAHDDKMG